MIGTNDTNYCHKQRAVKKMKVWDIGAGQQPADTGFGDARGRREPGASLKERITATYLDQFLNQYGWPQETASEYIESVFEGERFRIFVDTLMSHYRLEGKDILEVGAGLGWILMELRRRGLRAVGLEPSLEWFQIAQQRLECEGLGAENIIQGFAESLPFVNSSQDFIISMQVLEHVKDVSVVMQEMDRVLRPGGVAYITAPNYFSFSENHYHIRWFPGLSKRLGALYLRSVGRNPDFYLNHINDLTYYQVVKKARSMGWLDHRKNRRATYGLHSFFRAEITYVFRKPAG
ncbi:MAG: class I SAM-dependent methyltransferase [Thermoleophilia bacterium]